MAFFDGRARDIEDNRNKKSSFNAVDPSTTEYLSELGVKTAIESLAVTNPVVTSVTDASTNNEIPTAKAVYDYGKALGSHTVNFTLNNDVSFGVDKVGLQVLLALNVPYNVEWNFECSDPENSKMIAWTGIAGDNEVVVTPAQLDGLMAQLAGYTGHIQEAGSITGDTLFLVRAYEFDTTQHATSAKDAIDAWVQSQGITWTKVKAFIVNVPEIDGEIQNGTV